MNFFYNQPPTKGLYKNMLPTGDSPGTFFSVFIVLANVVYGGRSALFPKTLTLFPVFQRLTSLLPPACLFSIYEIFVKLRFFLQVQIFLPKIVNAFFQPLQPTVHGISTFHSTEHNHHFHLVISFHLSTKI